MADGQPLAVEPRLIDAEPITRCIDGSPAPASVASTGAVRPGEVNGRIMIDELPEKIGLLPGEAELVAQHLFDSLSALFMSSAVRASSKLCD